IADIMHVEEASAMCVSMGVCPHKAATDAAAEADVIVADYNYMFTEIRDSILEKMDKTLKDCIIIIDEAHNLPDRITSELSGYLSDIMIQEAIAELKKSDPQSSQMLKSLRRAFISFTKGITQETQVKGADFINAVESNLRETLEPMQYSTFCQTLLEGARKYMEKNPERAFALEVAEFLEGWALDDSFSIKLISPPSDIADKNTSGPRLYYKLLDPSVLSAQVFSEAYSAIIMSGTLIPPKMYSDLLGTPPDRTVLKEYPSPFPMEHRLILIDKRFTTRLEDRTVKNYELMAEALSEIALATPGNSAFFFPSYDYAEEIFTRLKPLLENTGKREILVEKRDMDKNEKLRLYEQLVMARKAAGLEKIEKIKRYAVLVAVQGGSMSEGVDYKDNLLYTVVVIGLPLSPPTIEVKGLQEYYEKKFGQGCGKYYGYINPAMNKVLQAAGRGIRDESDKGVLVLMDNRFGWSMYQQCLPAQFRAHLKKTDDPAPVMVEFFRKWRMN
ncbi:MAG: ATP-dependent DNA helicase, partial [Thermoplasmata archaeon]